jgi:putative ABC transport system permease protein
MPRLRAIPGVSQVALVSNPIRFGAGTRRIEMEGKLLPDPKQAPSVTFMVQSPDYLASIDLPVLAGRNLNEADGAGGIRSALVTKALAERFWPHEDAVGKRLRYYDGDKATDWTTVVGITPDYVQRSDVKGAEPILMVAHRQEPYENMALVVRSLGPAQMATPIRQEIQRADQDLALRDVRTYTAAAERNLWMLRLFGMIFSTFAVIALAIASLGLYAVIQQATARRTQEIGVRMALGATSGNILKMVLSRGALQLGMGLALGMAAAWPAANAFSGLPIRVTGHDPIILVTVSSLLLLVGFLASWIPARRAAALEPVIALRDE